MPFRSNDIVRTHTHTQATDYSIRPLNWSAIKVTVIIVGQKSTVLQSFIQIGHGVSFPRMRNFAHRIVYSASSFGGLPLTLQA